MALGILRKIVEKRKEEKELAEREIHSDYPKDLPEYLKIKALIDISNAAFIIYGDHLNFEYPGKTHMVKKISSFTLYDLNVIRAYVSNLETNEETIVQFNGTKESGEYEVLDVLVFRLADTIYPQTRREWDNWLNEDDGLIGYKTLKIEKEGGDVVFERDWDEDGGEHIDPVEIREVVFTDPYEAPVYQTRKAMLYSKEIEGSDEYEYAFAEVVGVPDGQRIEISFGIVIEIANVTIH